MTCCIVAPSLAKWQRRCATARSVRRSETRPEDGLALPQPNIGAFKIRIGFGAYYTTVIDREAPQNSIGHYLGPHVIPRALQALAGPGPRSLRLEAFRVCELEAQGHTSSLRV